MSAETSGQDSKDFDSNFWATVEHVDQDFNTAEIVQSEIMRWDMVVEQIEYDILFKEMTGSMREELAAFPIIVTEALQQRYVRKLSEVMLQQRNATGMVAMVSKCLSYKYGLNGDEVDHIITLAMQDELNTQHILAGLALSSDEDIA